MADGALAAVDAGMGVDEAEVYDGRRARRERNNEAVIRACWELFAEGEMYPSAQQVADRSGVSLRSVFRHFQNLEGLVAIATAAYFAHHRALYQRPVLAPDASLDERIEAMVTYRISMYPITGTVMRAAIARSAADPQLAEIVTVSRQKAIEVVELLFAPELAACTPEDRTAMVAALHTATLVETWDNMVRLHGLTTDQVAAVYRRFLRAAVGA
jgi:AcrR family transcriptional regulator